jgi:hypothetical protein
MPETIKCKNCGALGEVSFGTCRVCTPIEILQAKMAIITERIGAAEDFKLLTAQLREQYITMRIMPFLEQYDYLVDEHTKRVEKAIKKKIKKNVEK